MYLRLLTYCLLFSVLQAEAQPRYNNNWYFGQKAALDFSTDPPTVKTDSKMNFYGNGASVSDELTGELLFYTNGTGFWNRHGELIDSPLVTSGARDMVIIPLKKFKNRFIVFNFSTYYIIDMEANGGRGKLIRKQAFPLRSSINRMTAVRHCIGESYWLITLDGYFFCAYLVHPDGTIDQPVVSANHFVTTTTYMGDFVSSNNGEKLALTTYAEIQDDFLEPQIFSFDKLCGKVGSGRELLPVKEGWDRTHGIAFSPDDKLIYVTFGYAESQLVQYDANNVNDFTLIATSPENFNQIACGPDGKLYITTHINSIPSNKIDVVLNPNIKGPGCNYRENYLRLAGIAYFEVPNLVINHTGTCRENKGFTLEVDEVICNVRAVNFRFEGDSSAIDSMRWFYNDTLKKGLSSADFTTNHLYQPGYYEPFAVIYSCNSRDTFYFAVNVSDTRRFPLGNDSTLCAGDSLRVGYTVPNALYTWNTGESTAAIYVRTAGLYIREVNRLGCKTYDSIRIGFYPTLELLLGDNYYICEEEKELVKLDAGKGHKTYLWHPTNDTTHWIEVDRKGNYYVVVKDYRGCKGNDRTIVESRCDLRVFLPNAFSPNGDGVNDVLNVTAGNHTAISIRVFNVWGELVYEGEPSWDGQYKGRIVPPGVYMLKAEVQGFINKRPVQRSYSTACHVLY